MKRAMEVDCYSSLIELIDAASIKTALDLINVN